MPLSESSRLIDPSFAKTAANSSRSDHRLRTITRIMLVALLLLGAFAASAHARNSIAPIKAMGYSAEVSGDYAVVGAAWHDGYKGAAYLYRREGDRWVQVQKFSPPDLGPYDHFGGSVSISGDVVVVGAAWHDLFRGAAYVFTRDGDVWSRSGKLTAGDAKVETFFGHEVLVEDTRVLIAEGTTLGALVFENSGDRWVERERTGGAIPGRQDKEDQALMAEQIIESDDRDPVTVFGSENIALSTNVPAVLTKPAWVTATGGDLSPLETEVEITWAPSEDPEAEQDAIIYMVLRDDALLSVMSSDDRQYHDVTATFDSTYIYCIVVMDMNGETTDDVCADGERIIFAPVELVATDGEFTDEIQLSWVDRSTVNTGYSIRRDDAEIATAGPYAAFFSDTTAPPGTVCSYAVVATVEGGFESTAALDSSGWRDSVPPPTNVSATDGRYLDRVDITWETEAPDTCQYVIYRDNLPIGITVAAATSYVDSTIGHGVAATYCVATQKFVATASVPKDFQETFEPNDFESVRICDEGGTFLDAPTDVTASDSAYDDRVRVTWEDISEFEDGYEISRVAGLDTVVVGTTGANATQYDDFTAAPETAYTYLVRAVTDPGGASDYDDDEGFRSLVLPPMEVAASDSTFEDHVAITWTSTSTTVALFKIFRDDEFIKSVSSGDRLYRDQGGIAGRNYDYRVVAVTAQAVEATSVTDEGTRELLAPTLFTATDNDYEEKTVLSWDDVSLVEAGYVVVRENTLTAQVDTFEIGSHRYSWSDLTGASGVSYQYSVAAFDNLGDEVGYSGYATATGRRTLLAPTGLEADKGEWEDRITLRWRDNSNAENGYCIYCDGDTIGMVADNEISFVDLSPDVGDTIVYELRAYDVWGQSAAAVDSGYTVLLAPASFNASDNYEDRIELTWVDRSEIENGFRIYRDGVPYAEVSNDVTAYTADRRLTEGSYETPSSARGVHVVGKYAYVAENGAGLRIIDVSDPAQPTLTGTYDAPDILATIVHVVGNYAYVGYGENGLRIINVDNPAQPVLAGTYNDFDNWVGCLHVVGDYAYIGDGGAGLKIINVIDPTQPSFAGAYDADHTYDSVHVVGRYAYVTAGAAGLEIIDVNDPTQPAFTGTCDTEGYASAMSVHVVGRYAYVGCGTDGLQIIDVDEPTNPVLTGRYDTEDSASAMKVFVVGDYAFVACWTYGYKIIDVSDPAHPTLAGTLYDYIGEQTRDLHVVGDYAYLAHNSTFRIVPWPYAIETLELSDAFTFEVEAYEPNIVSARASDEGRYADKANTETAEILGKLLASNGTTGDNFGNSVSISNDRAIVGANYGTGLVYFFEHDGNDWNEVARFGSPGDETGLKFGSSVAIDGDHAVVGEPDMYFGDTVAAGTVWFYERGSDGIWNNSFQVNPPENLEGRQFGTSVALSGDYAIVGAPNDSTIGIESGSAYIFELENSEWVHKKTLLPDDTAVGDRFGNSVSISGNRAIVGAPQSGLYGSGGGRAYIFELVDGLWTERELLASDLAQNDSFGSSVSISGNRAIVGTPGTDYNGITQLQQLGCAYIFELVDGQWIEQKLLASDGAALDLFGNSVSISENRAIVGAVHGNYYDEEPGCAYIFELVDGQWIEQRLLASDGAAGDRFGYSVSISGDRAIVGAPDDDDNGHGSGSAYIMELPERPLNLIASDGTQNSRVSLTWQDRSINEQAYRVFRDGVQIADLAPNTAGYDDLDAEPGRTYRYDVSTMADNYVSPPTSDFGWRPADGSITGRISTPAGAGADNVRIAVSPLPTRALQFDGSGGYVEVEDEDGTFDFGPGEDYTVEAWVRYQGSSGAGETMIAKAALGSEQAKFPFTLRIDNGEPGRLVFAVSDSTTPVSVSTARDNINDYQWHHVACVHDAAGDTLLIYVDGILDTSYFYGELGELGDLTNAEPLTLGAGPEPDSWYNGLLDEIRIWGVARDATQIEAAWATRLSGEESGLVAWWPIGWPAGHQGEGSPNVITDLGSKARYGELQGGVYFSNNGAAIDIDGVTDWDGNYVIPGIFYGTDDPFEVRPYDGNRRFDPPVRHVALTRYSPVENQVDFNDVSSFTVSGTIRYDGTDCGAANIPVFVDSQPAGSTDSKGKFAVTADLGIRTIEPILEGHTFEPASMELDVLDDTTGVAFDDLTTYTLSGRLGGGCGKPVGEITITVRSENECHDRTRTYPKSDTEYSMSLPPQNYFVFATVDSITDGLDESDVTSFFQNLGTRYAEVGSSDFTMDFVYRAPLVMTIEGLGHYIPDDCGPLTFEDRVLPDSIPVVEQLTRLYLTLEVYEDYGGDPSETCPLESGTVKIYDELMGLEAMPLLLEVREGFVGFEDANDEFQPYYPTIAAAPSLIVGRTDEQGNDRSFQKQIRAVAEVEGRPPVSATQWVLVTGHVAPEGADFITVESQPLELMILRDPPGDNSYAFLDEGYSTRVLTEFDESSITINHPGLPEEQNLYTEVKQGFDFTIALDMPWKPLGIEFPFAIYDHDYTEVRYTQTTDTKKNTVVTTTMNERFSTSAEELFTGNESDIYIGAGVNFVFSKVGVVEVDEHCRISNPQSVGFEPEGFATTFAYTESHITDVLIPELEKRADEVRVTCLDSALYFEEEADAWRGMIARNDSLKSSAERRENRSFSAGADYSSTFSSDSTVSRTVMVSTRRNSLRGEGTFFNAMGFYQNDRIRIDTHDSMAVSGTDTSETEMSTIGYVLSDNDIGDRFSVDIKQDDYFPTPVFGVRGGASSCPYEAWPDTAGSAGMYKRDNPWLDIVPARQDMVPPDRHAVFTLQLHNRSETEEPRLYALRLLTASNQGGAIVRVAGEPIMDGLQEYFVDYGNDFMQEAMLTVERGPTRNEYEDLQVILYPPCEYELWQQGAAMAAACTLSFSVTFEDQGPLAFGTPEPADGELSFGEDISLTFNEVIDCESILEDSVTIQYLDEPNVNETVDINILCDGRTIILEPDLDNVDPNDLEGRRLRARVSSVGDPEGNLMTGDVTWDFVYRKSLFTWSDLQLSRDVHYFNPASVTTELVNGTVEAVDYTVSGPEPAVDWFTISPMSGTLIPGAVQTITLDIRDDLAIGTYETQVAATTSGSDPRTALMDVYLAVTCGEPEWVVNPSSFEHSMTMVAEVQIGEDLSADQNDKVAAFVGNQLRGVAHLDNVNGLGQPDIVFLTIYSNRLQGETVRFKVWDDNECRLYNATDRTFPFDAIGFIGSPDDPVHLIAESALGDDVLSIPVNEGWTLISTNVYSADDMAVSGVLSDLTPTAGDIIKSQSAFSQFVDIGTGWSGSLTHLDTVSAYMLRLAEPGLILHTGTPVVPPYTIPVVGRWNWISYLPAEADSTGHALSGLSPIAVDGDVIKSQDAFAEYWSSNWYGNLKVMEPGKGYKLYLADADTVPGVDSFNYPESLKIDISAAAGPVDEGAEKSAVEGAPSWVVNPHAYQNNMTVTAVLWIDSTESIDEQDQVAAFVGEQCRGVGRPVYIESLRRYEVFLMIHSNATGGEEITLRAFDADAATIYDIREMLAFEADGVQGSVAAPVVLTTSEIHGGDGGVPPRTFSLGQNRPNPFNPTTDIDYDVPASGGQVSIKVYDIAGRRIRTLVDAVQTPGRKTVTWNGRNDRGETVATGIYFYRMTAPGFERTKKLTMIK